MIFFDNLFGFLELLCAFYLSIGVGIYPATLLVAYKKAQKKQEKDADEGRKIIPIAYCISRVNLS